jgi:hypothetical protein
VRQRQSKSECGRERGQEERNITRQTEREEERERERELYVILSFDGLKFNKTYREREMLLLKDT